MHALMSIRAVRIRTQAYIAQALYIAHEIAFGIDGLVDRLPSPFLFGHSIQPKQAQLNMFQVALTAEVPHNPKPGFRFQVQTARRRRWGT
jgi:hypothetical protein